MKLRSCVLSFLFFALSVCFVTAAQAAWLDTTGSGGIAYFLFDSPPQIQRYDMNSEAWIAPIALAEAPTAFAVDSDGLYVAFGRRTARFNLDGTGEIHLQNTASDVTTLVAGSSALYLFSGGYYSANVLSVDKFSGGLIDQGDYYYSITGVSIAESAGKLIGRDQGLSPCDIRTIDITPGGELGALDDSPYHGDFPCGSRTWVLPGGARVTDDAGIVYTTNDLTYNNSFAGSFDDIAFYGTIPIVLRDVTLTSYSAAFLPVGSATLPHAVDRIFVQGETIFSFFEVSAGTLDVLKTPVSDLSPPEPSEPVDPHGLAYVPDSVFLASDGIVYLLSKANLSVFRWSVAQGDYLPTIPLAEAPSYMAYSDVNRRLYFGYPSGSLRMIDLEMGTAETPFANLPQQPIGLSTAGEFLFACDGSGAWATHWVFSPGGDLRSQVDWNYYSREYSWSPANRRMYFFRDDSSPNDLHWESIDVNGTITGAGESPYHGEVGTVPPIRIALDGSVVLLGSGEIYDGQTIVHVNDLSNDISDAAWLGDGLFTIRPAPPYTEIQRWTGNYGLDGSFMVGGSPIRLFALENELLVITDVSGIPRFSLRSPDAGDLDDDGVPDHLDNCPEVANVDQADADGDGTGDACNDAVDADGDDWGDALDNCPAVPNPDQANADGDPLGDACDPYPNDYLRLRVIGPPFAVSGIPANLLYTLERLDGSVVTDIPGIRMTLTLTGSAVFGSKAVRGTIVDGGGTGRVLVEFAEGFAEVPIDDPIAETVVASAEDTQSIGVAILRGVFEDFEQNDGSFTYEGPGTPWEHGVPTSGPNAAHSGNKVWATNLAGDYVNGTSATLTTPVYPTPVAPDTALSFWSWFAAESCCDPGYVEISTDGGAYWQTVEYLSGWSAQWSLRSYSLLNFSGESLRVRFRFHSDGSITGPGWYIDDFRITGLETRVRFIVGDGDEDGDGLSNRDEIIAGTDLFDSDTDDDGALDGADNCPLLPNWDQSDVVHPNGVGDACEDPDLDGVFDMNDNCPDASNPDQLDAVHPNGVGDACEDPDADGVSDATDNCSDFTNPDQSDGDGDTVGTACDRCPTMPNPSQQEGAACIQVSEDGGTCLETRIELVPGADSGEIRIYDGTGTIPQAITFEILATSCGGSDILGLTLNGVSIGDVALDPQFRCNCLTPVQRYTVNDTALLDAIWIPGGMNVFGLNKRGGRSGVAWVRARLIAGGAEPVYCLLDVDGGMCDVVDLCAAGAVYDAFFVNSSIDDSGSFGDPISVTPFQNRELPGLIALGALPGSAGRVCVVRTDSPEMRDCVPFVRVEETLMAINGAICGPPVAEAGADDVSECTSPAGATVRFDGSASSDPNSSPGTNDDIVRFEWFEGYGTAGARLLGEGQVLSTVLPLGRHEVTLLVTDSSGASDTDELTILVRDTTAPEITVSVTPSVLKPANHRMVPVHAVVAVTDACGVGSAVLNSVVSSEPDDAPGNDDGRTVNDIQGVQLGTFDTDFSLRAERAKHGPGRVYTITYLASDPSGNSRPREARVTVKK